MLSGQTAILYWIYSSRTIDDVEKAIHAIVDWKLNILPTDLRLDHFDHETMSVGHFPTIETYAVRTLMFTGDPQQNFNENIICMFYTATAGLQASYTLSVYSTMEDILEVLWILHNPLQTDT